MCAAVQTDIGAVRKHAAMNSTPPIDLPVQPGEEPGSPPIVAEETPKAETVVSGLRRDLAEPGPDGKGSSAGGVGNSF